MYKYVIAAVIIVFLGYFSISFEKLDDVKEQRRRETFNAAQYARNFWDNQLFDVLDQAVDIQELAELFNRDMNEAIERYGKAPGVSRVYAYLIKGKGTILAIGEDFLEVGIEDTPINPDIKLAIGWYIPGNAVRDASGLIDVSQFSDTMKFNEISGEINKIVVTEVIQPFLDRKPQVGKTITFIGSIQIAQDATAEGEIQLIEVVPIRLEFE